MEHYVTISIMETTNAKGWKLIFFSSSWIFNNGFSPLSFSNLTRFNKTASHLALLQYDFYWFITLQSYKWKEHVKKETIENLIDLTSKIMIVHSYSSKFNDKDYLMIMILPQWLYMVRTGCEINRGHSRRRKKFSLTLLTVHSASINKFSGLAWNWLGRLDFLLVFEMSENGRVVVKDDDYKGLGERPRDDHVAL